MSGVEKRGENLKMQMTIDLPAHYSGGHLINGAINRQVVLSLGTTRWNGPWSGLGYGPWWARP